MFPRISTACLILLLVTPLTGLAQLSSENFVVEGAAISAPNISNSASSTNFQTEQESGGLFEYDTSSGGSGGSGGSDNGSSLRSRGNVPDSRVLGKLDPITICHTGNGRKYVALTNVQVFITLAETGPTAELRGHDGHEFDIVPAFFYDLGDGVETYPGKNWDAEGQRLYRDACGLFLIEDYPSSNPEPSPAQQPSSQPQPQPVPEQPESISEPDPEPPVPPVSVPIDVCEDSSEAVAVRTAIDDQTLVEFNLPTSAARSKKIEATKSDYRLLVQVKPVSTKRTNAKQKQLVNALKTLLRKQQQARGNQEPYGLIKKLGTNDQYRPPQPRFDTTPASGGGGEITIGNPDCETIPDNAQSGENEAEAEASGPTSGDDIDGDGIPNDVDPDDNNDGTPDDPRNAIIYAHKIICEDESMLPDWGNRGGPNITRSTAATWVTQNPGCEFASDWYFEWGEQGVRNPGDNATGPTGNGWNVFGPTDGNGLAWTTVTNIQIKNNRHFWFREVLPPGYLGYTYRYDRSSYSAEMYCHSDVLNYDNFDRIDGIKTNDSFSCIAWNVADNGSLPPDDGVNPLPDSDSDGVPDILDENDGFPDIDTDGDGIPDSSDPNPTSPDGDTDGDGLPNVIDEDDDNDGISDETDTDNDNDGIPDDVDEDDDNDGEPDISDDEPTVPNTESDHDGDGVPDIFDEDDDNDGITDAEDDDPFSPVDTDGDGVNDADEVVIIVSGEEFDTSDIDTVINGDVLTPIDISIVDETGAPIDSFESVVDVHIFNPIFADLETDEIVVLQPSDKNSEWFAVPHQLEGDTLTVELIHPGEIFIWIKPKEAEAFEITDLISFPDFPSITVPKVVLEAVTASGLISGLFLTLFSALRAPFSLGRTGLMLFHLWHNLLAFLTFKKRRRPWGTVYDSVSKVPIDPAYIELFDSSGKKHASAITDLDGRYGFLVSPGEYKMTVRKTHYAFPAGRHLGQQDVIYKNLYYGGVTNVDTAITHDIPMDPKAYDWNQFEKLRTNRLSFFSRFDPWLVRILDALFFAGAFMLLWQVVSIPTLGSFILLAIYLVLLYRRFMGGAPKIYGHITKAKQVLPHALIKVYRNDHELTSRVADAEGRYFVLVPPGTYRLEVFERVSEDSFEHVATKQLRAKDGVLNARIRL